MTDVDPAGIEDRPMLSLQNRGRDEDFTVDRKGHLIRPVEDQAMSVGTVVHVGVAPRQSGEPRA
jgi:hypothetical protein